MSSLVSPRKWHTLLLSVAVAIGIVAAMASVTSAEHGSQGNLIPVEVDQDAPRDLRLNHDQLMLEVNEQFPGFGGYAFEGEDSSVLAIIMTDPTAVDDVNALATALDSHFRSNVKWVRLIQGQYEYAQLVEWKQRVPSIQVDATIVSWGVQPGKNRLGIRVEDEKFIQAVSQALPEAGIPTEAAVVEHRFDGVVPLDHNVQHTFDPVPGGVKISVNIFCTR